MEEEDRHSAVIPSLRGKPPPRTPSASRQASRAQSRHSAHSYDPVASVERHQSVDRMASRASQRSEKENERRNSSSSRQRSSSRSSRRASTQSTQAKPAVDRQHLQESYEVPDAGGGGVATDAYGRPTSFTIM
ncbi:unnamed protein product [Cylicocyclus nassatus]|uniref:Uncharacterized protein n=1 Tax=Cylicocyclus nassatus TaxID=53992 RepID=A0AA36HGY5_CYLNA|nr:unnamed protein product [Cylicocyclus nassatus]